MAKDQVAHRQAVTDTAKAPAEETAKPENDRGERVRLGKRYPMWKPGHSHPLTGYLLGISGVRLEDGGVQETLIVRADRVTDAWDWDVEKKEAVRRDAKVGEDLAVFLTAGLEPLRAYAIDAASIRHVYIPIGEKIKLKGGKTFWRFVSDDPKSTNTLDVSAKQYKRNASTIVAQVAAKSPDDAPARVQQDDEGGSANEDYDEIPF